MIGHIDVVGNSPGACYAVRGDPTSRLIAQIRPRARGRLPWRRPFAACPCARASGSDGTVAFGLSTRSPAPASVRPPPSPASPAVIADLNLVQTQRFERGHAPHVGAFD